MSEMIYWYACKESWSMMVKVRDRERQADGAC